MGDSPWPVAEVQNNTMMDGPKQNDRTKYIKPRDPHHQQHHHTFLLSHLTIIITVMTHRINPSLINTKTTICIYHIRFD